MRKTLLMSAALLGMSGLAAIAQTNSNAQSPASPGASSQMPQPTNSLPAGGATMPPSPAAGNAVGGVTTTAPTPMGAPLATGAAPAPATEVPHARRADRYHRRGAYARRGEYREQAPVDPENPGGGQAPADHYTGVPPTNAYQGGTGSPYSTRASNIDQADTRSLIAPRLPDPDASGNTPRDYLAAAQRALSRNQTGAAQEALERAQTRILTRSTDPSMANAPDDAPVSRAIADARRALANNNIPGARSAIDAVLSR